MLRIYILICHDDAAPMMGQTGLGRWWGRGCMRDWKGRSDIEMLQHKKTTTFSSVNWVTFSCLCGKIKLTCSATSILTCPAGWVQELTCTAVSKLTLFVQFGHLRARWTSKLTCPACCIQEFTCTSVSKLTCTASRTVSHVDQLKLDAFMFCHSSGETFSSKFSLHIVSLKNALYVCLII